MASFFMGLLLLSSCEESPTMIGGKILPSEDHISLFSTDTFNIISYTNYVSKVSTEALISPYIGVYNDPYFGTTTSGFVSQLRLEKRWSSWDADSNRFFSWEVDSVKLFLRVTSNYGSNEIFHHLRISEISKMLYDNTVYYSDDPVDTTGVGVSAIIPPLRSDTINKIEITLSPSFGKYMISDTSKLFYTTEANEEDFRDHFKGIYITIPSASATNPFLLGFNFNYFETFSTADSLYDYQNYIILYLSDKTDSIPLSYSYRFLLDPRKENAHFTKMEHDLNANIKNAVDQQIVDTLSYAQGLHGVYTTISIPGLETIKNDPSFDRWAVNKARLIAPVHLDNVNNYTYETVAQSLLMRYVNASGEKEMVPDYSVGIDQYNPYSLYFDGTLDTTKYVYNFNLSNFVQNYFNDTQNKLKPEVEIFLPANSVPNTILKANNSETPLKFEITLSNF